MTTNSTIKHQFFQCVIFPAIVLIFTSCKKEEPDGPPSPTWQNTFTPTLENNNQRDTVFDDENITFSTSNTPSDRYIWSWGDGSKSDTTQTIYAIHQFKRLGMNIVKLRVERGNTYGEKTDSIWVIHHDIPQCEFRIDSDDSLYVENTSHFVANISSTSLCQSTCSFDYQWDFGDGSTGIGYHTIHSYTNTGNYLVRVSIIRCEGSIAMSEKHIVVTGNSAIHAYRCICNSAFAGNSFSDTIYIQNLPLNPIKVDGGVLRRSGDSNRYSGDFNCTMYGCDTYTLDAYHNLDSIRYRVVMPFVDYTCLGSRI